MKRNICPEEEEVKRTEEGEALLWGCRRALKIVTGK
jgi:hypothetical protein